jgi:hypothetical protein
MAVERSMRQPGPAPAIRSVASILDFRVMQGRRPKLRYAVAPPSRPKDNAGLQSHRQLAWFQQG